MSQIITRCVSPQPLDDMRKELFFVLSIKQKKTRGVSSASHHFKLEFGTLRLILELHRGLLQSTSPKWGNVGYSEM